MAALTRSSRIAAGTAVALLATAWASTVPAQRLDEYQVKAAFLHNFAKFVEWPASAPGPTFELCVLGDDPFGRWLDEATAGARVKDRPIAVRRMQRLDDTAGCRTLFISGSEAARVQLILDGLRAAPVLTVSDLPQFAQRGGMIGFTTVGGRVRFVANPGTARASGLHLTSELLRVAAGVVGGTPAKE